MDATHGVHGVMLHAENPFSERFVVPTQLVAPDLEKLNRMIRAPARRPTHQLCEGRPIASVGSVNGIAYEPGDVAFRQAAEFAPYADRRTTDLLKSGQPAQP